MANLKALRTRIDSVKSTQKLTSAMKMVAAAKLRRAQLTAVSSRPYAGAIGALTAKSSAIGADEPLVSQGANNTELIVATASDRGLAGAFNVNVARAARRLAQQKQAQGKQIKLFVMGKKLPPLLGRDYKQYIIATMSAPDSKNCFPTALEASKQIIELKQKGEIDSATLVYAFFRSPLVQEVKTQAIIPLMPEENANTASGTDTSGTDTSGTGSHTESGTDTNGTATGSGTDTSGTDTSGTGSHTESGTDTNGTATGSGTDTSGTGSQSGTGSHTGGGTGSSANTAGGEKGVPQCEQDEAEFLQELLPYNLAVQLNKALLENSASEHGARTTAMDNATRNAGEMIDTLTLNYNRARQAAITGELIEIISGAEAL